MKPVRSLPQVVEMLHAMSEKIINCGGVGEKRPFLQVVSHFSKEGDLCHSPTRLINSVIHATIKPLRCSAITEGRKKVMPPLALAYP